MAKIFYWLIPFYLMSFVASTAGEELFAWGLFLLFLFDVSFDLKKTGFKTVLQNLKTGADIPVLFFGFWALVGTLIIFPNPHDLNLTVGSIRWIFLLYGISYLMKKYFSLNYEKYFKFILVCTTLVGIYGVVQMFTRIDLVRLTNDHISVIGNFYRATGFFSVPLTYAYCLGSVGLFGFAALLVRSKIKLHYALPLITTISVIGGVIASSTRGAWIALFVAVVLMTFLIDKKKALFVFIAASVLAGLLMLEPSIKDRVYSITNVTTYSSNTQRIDLWKANFEMFKDHPLLGVGIERSKINLDKYYEKLGIQNGFSGNAHNDFLNTLSGVGLPGIICWLWFCGYFIYLAFKLFYQATDYKIRTLTLGAIGAQIYLHIGGITQANFYDNEVKHIIVFIWVLLIGIQYQLSNRRLS